MVGFRVQGLGFKVSTDVLDFFRMMAFGVGLRAWPAQRETQALGFGSRKYT